MANKLTSKYFKYAIGEIVLVVIGILIALSINNWNEGRILQNDTNNTLAQIFNDLQQDKKVLEAFDTVETEHISTLTAIVQDPNNTRALDGILQSLDHYMSFSINNNGYASLKNSGKISNINNSKLKSSLTNYYEKTSENLSIAFHFAEKFTNDRVIPFSIENLKPTIDMSTSTELVLEKLETSNLRYLINYQISVKNYSLGQMKKGLKINSELIQLIEQELSLLK
jgi:hypothetical protein